MRCVSPTFTLGVTFLESFPFTPLLQTPNSCLFSPALIKYHSQEIKSILNNTVERNTIRRKIALKRRAFDAWRQVVEVMVVGCNNELVPARQTLLVELTQAILGRSRDGHPLAGLLSSASGCVVLLVQQLRYTTQIPNSDIQL